MVNRSTTVPLSMPIAAANEPLSYWIWPVVPSTH